jgi:hypothetical protein
VTAPRHAREPGDSRRRTELRRAERGVALLVAVVWLVAGALAVVLGLQRRAALPVLLGAAAAWYGLVWVRVVRTGRRLERLSPFRRER